MSTKWTTNITSAWQRKVIEHTVSFLPRPAWVDRTGSVKRQNSVSSVFSFSETQLWPQSHALPTYPFPSNPPLLLLLRPNSTPSFWACKIGWDGSDPLDLDPPMALEPNAGSSLVKMVLMLKVLASMAANPVTTSIEMMLNRFFFLSQLSLFTYMFL